MVPRADLQVESDRIRQEIVNAKCDLLKWGIAAVGLILAAVYTFS